MNVRNKKVIYTIIGIAAVILVTIGITYAYWLITKNQTGENVISSACLDISLTNEENDITLTNQFPLSDADGMKLTPYEFTVTNNCNTSVDYHINLESIGAENEAVKALAIKAVIDDNEPQVLSDYSEKDITIEGAYEAHLLGAGTLAANDTEGSSATHNLRLWIDKDAPISEMNKTFRSKITVTIGQEIEASQGNTLAALILNHAQTNNYLHSTTPDFSKVTSDGEYGLYTSQDDYGTSYYFRGDVESNFVKFGHSSTAYVPADIPDEALATESGQIFAPMVFGVKVQCELLGQRIGLWTTCEENTDITKVFYSNIGMEEEFRIAGFATEQSCISMAGVKSCEEKEIEIDFYWRIVRINGDGTIRLVYDGTNAVAISNDHFAIIGVSAYNSNYDDAKYVGYTYDDGNGNQVDSTIKSVLDEWYSETLEDDYGKYIADSIFCNDREVTSSIQMDYGAHDRLYTNKSPALTCTNQSDRYTVEDTKKGNGLLTNPVGLITADEVSMAGGVYSTRGSTTYLNSSDAYWTSSPFYYSGGNAIVLVNDGGTLKYEVVNTEYYGNEFGPRPVINLKADVLFAGSGTKDDPYKLVTE